ncbi:MAG: hypothetical protein ABSG38_05900 [Spirochaetia bacterium]|jgi:hypothetical protein
MKRAALTALALLGTCVSLFAQYGAILHTAAGEDRLTVGSSILLVGAAAGSLRPETGAAEARSTLQKLGIRLPAAPDDSPITYGGYAFLLAQLFDLPGSAAYVLIPGPLSAFDELQSRGLIPYTERSGHPVRGTDALLLLRRVIEQRGPSR